MNLRKKLCSRKTFFIFLPFPLLIAIPQLEWAKTIYYTTLSIILCAFSILLNTPSIVHFLHGKPVHFEDLEDNMAVDTITRKRFQRTFEVSFSITLSILIGALLDYYLDQFNDTSLSKLELLGILGGFLSLLTKCENFIGKCLLILLHCYKVEYSPRQTSITPKIQMVDFNLNEQNKEIMSDNIV